MTFATRDHYRHVVERIAKRTKRSERDVAETALKLAAEGQMLECPTPRRAGTSATISSTTGCAALEAATGYTPPSAKEALHRWVLRHPNVLFIGGIGSARSRRSRRCSGSAACASQPAARAADRSRLFALIPANEIAVERDEPAHHGVPPAARAAQAGPLRPRGHPARVPHRGRRCRRCSAAWRPCTRRWRISRCSSSPTARRTCTSPCSATSPTRTRRRCRTTTRSSPRRWRACARSTRATRRDAPTCSTSSTGRGAGIRARACGWAGSASAASWREFNRFLRGGARDAFSVIEGDVDVLRQVRYVITLDADTVLPPDAAPLLVGTLAHPLNRAVYDPETRARRARLRHPAAARRRVAAERVPLALRRDPLGHPGVDPYTTAVSDVYQDLYGEGSFTGKGIYDVDAFEQATHGRFPENTLLSHDLIEGSYARAGLVTDIEVFDDYPTRYLAVRAAQAPLDSRRLAAAALAAAARSGPGRPRAQPAVAALAVEDLRQPAPQPRSRSRSSRFFVAGWTVLARLAAALDAARAARDRRAVDRRAAARGAAPAARQVVARVLRDGRRTTRGRACSRSASRSRSCRTRRGSRPTRSCARCGARCVSRRHLLEWQTASQAERATSRLGARRAGARCGRRSRSPAWRSRSLVLRAEHARAPAARGRSCWRRCRSSRSGWRRPPIAHRAQRAGACDRKRRLAAPLRARGAALRARALAVLRAVRRRGDELARPGQLPGRPGPGRRDAHVADEHRAAAALHGERARPRLHRRSTTMTEAARAGVPRRSSGCAASAATSTTGTTCTTCACSSRRTSPRWTAAISPDISSRCARRASTIAKDADATPTLASRLDVARASARGATPRRWTSSSCSTASASCSRSATRSARTRSTRRPTTCSPPRRGSRASSRSRKNDVPVDHWFRLGRTLTHASGETALVSWSGSMFEYLMPALVMRSFPQTLLDQTYRGAVRRQIAYARRARRAVGHERERVQRARSPSHLSVPRVRRARPRAQARPRARSRHRAVRDGARGDGRSARRRSTNLAHARAARARSASTASATRSTTRGPTPGERYAVVKNYMAHHIGMSLVALDQRARRATSGSGASTPTRSCASAELLLHERIPRRLVFQPAQRSSTPSESLPEPELERPAVREFDTPDTAQPRVALLGHLPYTIMVSNRGAGYSRYEELAVTRWRADATTRRHRPVLLREGPDERPRVVRGAPAGVRAGRLVSRARSRPIASPSIASTATSRRAPRSPSCRRTRPRSGASR